MLEKNPKHRPTAYQCLKFLYESKKIDIYAENQLDHNLKLIDL